MFSDVNVMKEVCVEVCILHGLAHEDKFGQWCCKS